MGWESHWDVGSSGLLNDLPATETQHIFQPPVGSDGTWGSILSREGTWDPTEDCEPGLSRDSGGTFLHWCPLGSFGYSQPVRWRLRVFQSPLYPLPLLLSLGLLLS